MTEGTSQQGRGIGRMSRRAAAWVAWSVCSVSLLLVGFALVLIVLGWSTPLPKGWTPWPDQAVSLVGVLGAPVLGGLIASRCPENPYGWLWLGFGSSSTLIQVSESYAAYSLLVEPGSLPAPRLANGLLEGVAWVVAITVLPFLLLLFPTGHLPSRRWRPLTLIVLVAGAMGVTLGPFVGGDSLLIAAVVMVIVAASILSALSLAIRYRGAGGVERQQLKWFALAAALVVAVPIADLLGLDRLLGNALWILLDSVSFIGLYAAVGIAILRYRLYDVDIIINRTLVYGSLTAMLVALYFGVVVVLQRLFVLLTGQRSTVAVVASTLLIAALFDPLRKRIQSFIDRSFYRRKYDAAKTLEGFSMTLRDETDLDSLSEDLVGVVRETMQPTHASLWLRSKTASDSDVRRS